MLKHQEYQAALIKELQSMLIRSETLLATTTEGLQNATNTCTELTNILNDINSTGFKKWFASNNIRFVDDKPDFQDLLENYKKTLK